MRRIEPPELLKECPVIAVLRAREARDCGRVVDVLADGGVRTIELTLSTPGTFDYMTSLTARTDIQVGVGTVTTVDQARQAVDRGAAFLVTPIMELSVVEFAVDRQIPVFAGGLTPTELYRGWRAGATAVKIFPAETVGPLYGAHLRGPFPDLRFVPSGGVSLVSIPEWPEAGALAVSVGGPLIGDALVGGDLDELRARVQRVVAAVPNVERDPR